MILRQDLLNPDSPKDLQVFQLTSEPGVPSSHLYMEAQVFTPDSKRLILHRSAHAHGSDSSDPKHQYLLCDLDNNGELTPIATELGVRAASVSPDGEWLYYFVDETTPGGGRLTLKRVRLDGADRQVLHVLDTPLPETGQRFSRPYPLSTMSSDSQRIAISGFLGDGKTPNAPWGILVYDIAAGARPRLILHGPTWLNMHPQYCRSQEPDASHDILIQENHGNESDARGQFTKLTGGAGADIHVIRDDGTHFRNMPWGRDNNEFCQGHQCWRGRSRRGITSTSTVDVQEAQLIEGVAAPHAGHVGRLTPGGERNDLSRQFPKPNFYHFATDIAGRLLITDSGKKDQGGRLYIAELPDSPTAPFTSIRPLLTARTSWDKTAHIHPFLSPDGKAGFFNSDETGVLQAYMVRGF
ncbi:MAG TPA: hypothetical protein P5137_06860 [Candidatus Brocadiia bacterium]|nr:hypothetical protein [Candidatus Brocadiia bacterium]